jgi:O-antigen/teichoic acid export membrane protein
MRQKILTKQKAKDIIKHPLIFGSGILVFGNLFANFINLLFYFVVIHAIPASGYGIFASVMSLISYPILIGSAINPLVVRFAADYFAHKNYALLRGLYIQIKKLLLIIGIVIFLLFLICISAISNFLHITDTTILFITGVIIFIALIGVINMAFLQAKLSFGFQVIVNLTNALVKLIIGAILILLGYSLTGITFAVMFAGVVSYLISFLPLRFVFDRKISSPSIANKDLFLYGFPSALALFGLTSFISSDILLVKHFFDPHQAGLYAGLSLIGRIIFFVSAPIATVMFPMIVQKHSKKENYTNTFKLSLLLVITPSIILTIFYSIFPHFSILFFLKRPEYLAITPYLVPFSIFITFYSVLSILSNFYLAINRTRIFIPIIIGAVAQIVLIYFLHQTFIQIISISLICTVLLDIMLLLYYPYATKK